MLISFSPESPKVLLKISRTIKSCDLTSISTRSNEEFKHELTEAIASKKIGIATEKIIVDCAEQKGRVE